ncbi:hypothetical protein V5N11_019868 [Cardamine amara subsp. amara]|uniref:DUF4283 domain-containing protein n=1 Tax=Cardamine amara subsp. amara TaxID=228776 RepID=A0ABD1A1E6_CARAN
MVGEEVIPTPSPVVTNPLVLWVNVVQKKKSLTKYDLKVSTQDDVCSVDVPDEVFEDPAPLWEDFFIGKFLDSAPHAAKVHAIVNKIWELGDEAQMIDVHVINSTIMKFRISNPVTRNRVLRRGMWNLAEVPVIMSKWTHFLKEKSPEISSVPLWVHLKNVPIEMFSWKGLSFVTSAVGEPICLHPDTAQCLDVKVAKVFVKADLTKDFSKSKNLNYKGKNKMVEYSYLWLPPKCSLCEKWGHLHTVCVANKGLNDTDREQALVVQKAAAPSKEVETQSAHVMPVLTEILIDVLTESLTKVLKEALQEKTSQSVSENNEGWSTPVKGRSPTKENKILEYGEVSILSNTRFSVLSDTIEEEGK